MRKIISYILIFQLVLTSVFVDGSNVTYVEPQVRAFTEDNITMRPGGTVTHPTVVLNVDTDQAIAGVTYELGHGKTATKTSPRLYGVVAGQDYEIKDIYRYVSVYVQLEDGSSATRGFELTGNRSYNSGSSVFARYPERALTDNSSTTLDPYIVTASVSGDSGVMAVVDDEIWQKPNTHSSIQVLDKAEAAGKIKATAPGGRLFLYRHLIDVSGTLGGPNVREEMSYITYDGRFVMFINEARQLVIVEKTGKTKTVISAGPNDTAKRENIDKVIKNYSIVDGKVQGIVTTQENLYILGGGDLEKKNLYKATRQEDGTYVLEATPVVSELGIAPASGPQWYSDMLYDGKSIWILQTTEGVGSAGKAYKWTIEENKLETVTLKNKSGAMAYDGKEHIYFMPLAQVNTNTAVQRVNINTLAVDEPPMFSPVSGVMKEALNFDGRNIWIWSYMSSTNAKRYDTVEQIAVDTKRWSPIGPSNNVMAVYDGDFQWLQQWPSDFYVLARPQGLRYGTGSTNLGKAFPESPGVTDPTTPVMVDDNSETKPNYVSMSPSAGDAWSSNDIVQVSWAYDGSEAGADSRTLEFFQNMDNFQGDDAYRGIDHTEYAGKTDGKYFEIPSSSSYFPTRNEDGKINFAIPTFPKLNGYYTLYMRNADGDEVVETIYVDNYLRLATVNLEVVEVDGDGNIIDPENIVYRDIDTTREAGTEATFRITTQIPTLEEEGYMLFGSDTRRVQVVDGMTVKFFATKDLTKWGKLHLKPYYMKDGEKVYLDYTNSDLLYLAGTEISMNAPHFDGYRLLNLEDKTKTATILGNETGEPKIVELEFEYVPNDGTIIARGIGVDATGKPTGEYVYSEIIEGDDKQKLTVAAKDSTEKWEKYGLVNYNADGTYKDTTKDVFSKEAIVGTDLDVVFAYQRKQADVVVQYILNDDETVIGQDSYSPNIGETLVVKAKDIPGYRLVDGSAESIEINTEETITNPYKFRYVRNGLQVGVKGIEVDADGNETGNVVYSKQYFGEENTKETITPDVVGNWNYYGLVTLDTDGSVKSIDKTAKNKEVTYGTDTEVVFAYQRKMTLVEIKYVEETTGESVSGVEEYSVPLNSEYTSIAKAIEGFELVDPSTYRITITASEQDKNTITFQYKRIIENVTLEARLDSKTGKLLAQHSVDLPLGSKAQTVAATELISMLSPRYVLDTTQSTPSYEISVVEGDTKVVFVFKEMISEVTMRYHDKKGNTIAPDKTFKIPYGETIRESAISIRDYYLVDTEASTFEKVADKATDGKTFVYNQSVGSIGVIAKDQDTGQILGYHVKTGEQGTTLSVDAEVLFGEEAFYENYALQGEKIQTLDYSNNHQEMVFNFKKPVYTVSLSAEDLDGNPLKFFDGDAKKDFAYKKGDSFTLYAPAVIDYEIAPNTDAYVSGENVSANVTKTFIYKKIQRDTKISILAVNEEGAIIGAKRITGNRDDKTTISIDDHTDLYDADKWVLKTGEEKTQDATFGTDYVVEFTFQRKTVKMTVKHREKGTTTILGEETIDVNTKSTVQAASSTFDLYQLDDAEPLKKDVSVETADLTVFFDYVKKDGNVVVYAKEGSVNGPLLETRYYTGTAGEKFTATKEDFAIDKDPGYTYDATNSVSVIEEVKDGQVNEATLVYNKKMADVIVSYVNTDGNPIHLPKEYKAQYGTSVEEYALNIDDYNISSDTTVTVKIDDTTATDGKVKIQFVYEHLEYVIVTDGVVNVSAQTADGDVLAFYSVNKPISEVTEHTFVAADIFGDITGYALDDDAEKIVIVKEGNNDIIFKYKEVKTKVTLVVEDEKGNALADPQEIPVRIGSDITVEAPHINEYFVTGTKSHTFEAIESEQTAKFVYKHISQVADDYMANVIVEGLDDADDSELYSYTIQLPFNKTFTLTAPTWKTYELIGDAKKSIEIGDYGTDGYRLTIRYKSMLAGANAYFVSDKKAIENMSKRPIEDAFVGEAATAVAEYIPGYKYLGYTIGSASGDIIESTIGVIEKVSENATENAIYFHYKPIVDENVTIYAIEGDTDKDAVEAGDRIIMMTAEKIDEDAVATASIDAPDLSNDAYVRVSDATKSTVLKDGKYEVVFVYEKVLADITINTYEDSVDGTLINTYNHMTANRVGESISVAPPNEGGYVLKEGEGIKKVMVDKDSSKNVVNFIYVKLPQNAVEVQLKETGEDGAVLNSYTVYGTKGERVVAKPMEMIGWKLVAGAPTEKEVLIGDEKQIIVYEYEEDVVELTATYVDNKGNAMTPASETVKVPKSRSSLNYTLNHTVYAPHFKGYRLANPALNEFLFTENNLESTGGTYQFVYQSIAEVADEYMATVVITGEDETGNTLYSMSAKVTRGEDYTAKALTLPTYSIDGEATKVVSISYDDNEVNVTFKYKTLYKTVETHYVDAETKSDLATVTVREQQALLGDAYSESAVHLNGYSYVGYTLGSADGTLNTDLIANIKAIAEDGNKIYFHYKKITSENVRIFSVEGSGDPTKLPVIRMDSAILEIKEGATLDVALPTGITDAGYTAVSETPVKVTYVPGQDTYDVYFHFTKDLASVTVKTYTLDEDGNKVYINTYEKYMTDQRVNETIIVTPPNEPGFMTEAEAKALLVQKEGNNVVEFEYKDLPTNEFGIKFIGKLEDGSEKLLTSYYIEGTIGDEISIEPITVPGWKLEKEGTLTILIEDVMSDQKVYYVPDMATLTISLVDEDGNEIPVDKSIQKTFETANSQAKVGYELNYTVYAPHINGWILAETESGKVVFTDANKDKPHKFVYQRIDNVAADYMRRVTVKGTKEGGDELYTYDMLVQRNKTYEIKALDVPTFALAEGQEETQEVLIEAPIDEPTGSDVETVEFKYVTTLSDVKIVLMKEVGTDSTNVYEHYKTVTRENAVIGQPYSENAPAHDTKYVYAGYTTDGATSAPDLVVSSIGKLDNVSKDGGNSIYFYYKNVTENVVVVFEEVSDDPNFDGRIISSEQRTVNFDATTKKGTVELKSDHTLITEDAYEMIDGEAYSVEVTQPTGVTYVEVRFKLKKKTQDIKIIVKDDVTGEVIYEGTHEDARVGEIVRIVSPNVVNYITPAEAELVTVSADGGQEVVFEAEKMDNKAITVVYKSKDEDTILQQYQIEAVEGQGVIITARDMVGWKLESEDKRTVTVEAETGAKAEFILVPDTTELTVKYHVVKEVDGVETVIEIKDDMIIETPSTNESIDYTLKQEVYAPNIEDYVLAEGEDAIYEFTDETEREHTFIYVPIEDMFTSFTLTVNITGIGETKTGEKVELYYLPVTFPVNSMEQSVSIPVVERIYGYDSNPVITNEDGTESTFANYTDQIIEENKMNFFVGPESAVLNMTLNYDYVEPGKGRVLVEGRVDETDEVLYRNYVQGDVDRIVSVTPVRLDGYTLKSDQEENVAIDVVEGTTIQKFIYTLDEPLTGQSTVIYQDDAGAEIKREDVPLMDLLLRQYYSVPGIFYVDTDVYELNRASNNVDFVEIKNEETTVLHYTHTGSVKGESSGTITYKYYTIDSGTSKGGSISPKGSLKIREGRDKSYTIKADEGYVLEDVRVNGRSIGTPTSYTFKGINKNQRIYAEFRSTEEEIIDKSKVKLDKVNHNSYMTGLPNNRFGPTEQMTRAQATVMFSRLLVNGITEGNGYATDFMDVDGSEWYANEIGYMVELGVVSGYPDGTFKGEQPITRGEFAVLASRFEELTLEGNSQFSDVEKDYWANSYVSSVANKGWMIGYPDGTFRPNNNITRAEVVTLVNRMLERQYDKDHIHSNEENIKNYVDVDKSYWAYYEISEASNGHNYTKSEDGSEETWTILH